MVGTQQKRLKTLTDYWYTQYGLPRHLDLLRPLLRTSKPRISWTVWDTLYGLLRLVSGTISLIKSKCNYLSQSLLWMHFWTSLDSHAGRLLECHYKDKSTLLSPLELQMILRRLNFRRIRACVMTQKNSAQNCVVCLRRVEKALVQDFSLLVFNDHFIHALSRSTESHLNHRHSPPFA